MPRSYISQVKLPGNATIYYIKDEEARDLIAQLGDFTAYLGVTTTELSDGSTTNPIIIDGESVTAVAGNIVSYNDTTTSLYTAKDFIFNGTKWQEFANPTKLGKFAYVNKGTATFTPNVTKTGTVTVTSTTLAATSIPATFGTTAVTGADPLNLLDITSSATVITGGSYSKATAATVTVDSSATFSGTLSSIVTNVTGGGVTKNSSSSLALYSVTGGQKIVTNVTSTGASAVIGLGASTTGGLSTYVTVPSDTEILTFSYITTTQSTFVNNITVTSGTYKVSVPQNTYVTSVEEVTPTIENVSVIVSGSAVTDSSVSITNTKTALTVTSTQKVSVPTSWATTSYYGKVSAYAGGDHNHTVTDTITVTGNEQTIEVNPST